MHNPECFTVYIKPIGGGAVVPVLVFVDVGGFDSSHFVIPSFRWRYCLSLK
nr:MAG TPA: hypothetical protein [Caudoviricetes sp.]